jgi:hypothetical protein
MTTGSCLSKAPVGSNLGAKVNDADMKPNAVPFLFLPGVALIGLLAGDWAGLSWALAVWTAVVGAGTLVYFVRHASERGVRGSHRVGVGARSPARPKG